MLNKKKICVVITARPSYSRVKSLLVALKESIEFDLQIVLSASALLDKYGKVEKVIEKDGFEITAKFNTIVDSDDDPSSMGITTGLGIIQLSQFFSNYRPDIVLTIADRFETLATAVAASYSGITLAHIQGGEITGNIDERVRHAITKLSDIHFSSSESAKNVIIQMGENPKYVFNVGCPSIDLVANARPISKTLIRQHLFKNGVGYDVVISKPYLVAIMHPVTTEIHLSDLHTTNLLNAINTSGFQCFWFWPNVDTGSSGTSRAIRKFRENNPDNKMRFIKNLDPEVFITLLKGSVGLIGNSSVGIRECAYLAIPVINIGIRQKGRDRADNVIDVGNKTEDLIKSIEKIKNLKKGYLKSSNIYGSGNSGKKISKILSKIILPKEKIFYKY